MGEGKIFGSIDEVVIAYENKVVGLHAKINLNIKELGLKKLLLVGQYLIQFCLKKWIMSMLLLIKNF